MDITDDLEKEHADHEPRSITIDTGKTFRYFKESIPIAAAIATIVGGTNQFYNLLYLDPYFVRFFSASQLVSDGLWILYLLFPAVLAFVFMIPFILTNREFILLQFDPIDANGNFVVSKALIPNLVNLFLIYGTCFYMILSYKWPYASILMLPYSFMAIKVNFILGQKYPTVKFLNLFGFIGIVTFLSAIYFTFNWIFKDNDIPNNFANARMAKNIISDEYPNYQYQILYMNDKYLFTKIYCDSINEAQAEFLLIPTDKIMDFKSIVN